MTTKIKYRRVTLTKTPSDGRGTFQFVINSNPAEGDDDNERIARWANLPGEFPLVYGHVAHPHEDGEVWGDPGAVIGKVIATSDPDGMTGSGQLDLDNPMAMAVYERMLLPYSDPLALKELSVGFAFREGTTYVDDNGVRVYSEATLLEVSVVFRGAQRTQLMDVKSRTTRDDEIARMIAAAERDAINARVDALSREEPRSRRSTDADLRRQLDELASAFGKGGKQMISTETAAVLTRGASLLAQSAVRAQVVGLVDAEAALMEASRRLRTIASGGAGDVQDVIDEVTPLVSALRTAGQPVAGDNLERTLVELAAVAGKSRASEPPLRGSVPVTVDERMRPVGAAAAVPTPDVIPGEVFQVPAVTTRPDSYRLEQDEVISHRREA
jgi:hypothetical protein